MIKIDVSNLIDTEKINKDFITNYAISFICGKSHILDYITDKNQKNDTGNHTVLIIKESELGDWCKDYHVCAISDNHSYFDAIKELISSIEKPSKVLTWDFKTLKEVFKK